LAAVVQLYQVTQSATGAEQLPFGILALNFDGERLGHDLVTSWFWASAPRLRQLSVSTQVVKIKSTVRPEPPVPSPELPG
jgi:hypothetical protein